MYLYFAFLVLYNEQKALHFILGGKTMRMENRNAPKVYTRPMVLSSQPIRFETAHSWNNGLGNRPPSNGNGGINYPHNPGTHPGNGHGGGHGGGKG